MFGKQSLPQENKKLISEMFSKSVYLYDANTLKLRNKWSLRLKHKDMELAPLLSFYFKLRSKNKI